MKLNEIFSKTAVTALALSLTLTTIATESSARTTTRGQAGPGGVLILFDAKTCIDPTKTYTNEGQIFSDLIFHSGGMKLCDSMLDILLMRRSKSAKEALPSGRQAGAPGLHHRPIRRETT